MPPTALGCFPFSEIWRGLRRYVRPGRRLVARGAEGAGACHLRKGTGAARRRVSPFGIGVAASLVGHALLVLLAFAWCSPTRDRLAMSRCLRLTLATLPVSRRKAPVRAAAGHLPAARAPLPPRLWSQGPRPRRMFPCGTRHRGKRHRGSRWRARPQRVLTALARALARFRRAPRVALAPEGEARGPVQGAAQAEHRAARAQERLTNFPGFLRR